MSIHINNLTFSHDDSPLLHDLSFSVEKKKTFKSKKPLNRSSFPSNFDKTQENKKKGFARKFVEQQETKDFIKKENKPAGKSKLKLKGVKLI